MADDLDASIMFKLDISEYERGSWDDDHVVALEGTGDGIYLRRGEARGLRDALAAILDAEERMRTEVDRARREVTGSGDES